ncbi:COG1216 Predicted glycosyltransferases [Burkholderiales bacterium]|jgi:GT2 family glycosyltransferase
MLTTTVVIPSFHRPDYLTRAIRSIYRQKQKPNELIVILRDSDRASYDAAIYQFSLAVGTSARIESVTEHGFLPPIYKAIESAHTDILAFMDDDAEAHSDWLEKLTLYYTDPSVAGVGGRYINYFGGKKAQYPPAEDVGCVTWYGKPIGNMYRDTTFEGPREVYFLIGGNMSYRLPVLRQSQPDPKLKNDVSFHWEIDVGMQVKRLGYRILFDPSIKVDHYSAPRQMAGLRFVNSCGIFWSNFNYAYLMRKHRSSLGLKIYLIYSVLIGWSDSPGLLLVTLRLLQFTPISWSKTVWPSICGRWEGLREPLSEKQPYA